MYLILALGNPGEKYMRTPHNAAWIVADGLVPVQDEWQENRYAEASIAMVPISGTDIMIAKPTTFMNESGRILPYFFREYDITPEQVIVMHDDLDLPIGTFKLSYDRGTGGHNGVASVVEHLGTQAFLRIRIGVSEDLGEGKVKKPPVLGRLDESSLEKISSGLLKLKKGLSILMISGKEKAMTFLNSGE